MKDQNKNKATKALKVNTGKKKKTVLETFLTNEMHIKSLSLWVKTKDTKVQ